MIFRIIFIALIMTSCGFEGEFDLAITEGGEHGQTKSVSVPDLPPYNEAEEIEKQTAITNEVNEEEPVGFSLAAYEGLYEWEFGNATITMNDGKMELSASGVGGLSGQMNIEMNEFYVANMQVQEAVVGQHAVSSEGIYSPTDDATMMFHKDADGSKMITVFMHDLDQILVLTKGDL